MIINPAATSQSITIQIVDDSGLSVTGLVAATFPTTSYERVAEALTGITLSDLAAINSAYSSGGVKEVGSGYYRLDVPDAAFATASKIRIVGEASGKHILYPPITCMDLPANVRQLLGTAWLTPATAGTPDVNAKLWNGLTTVALPLVPTTPGRTLDVSAGGEAGLDWANVGSPTTVLALANTTVGVVTTLTTLPAITSNWLTAAGIATDAITSNGIAASAVAEIQAGLATPTNITAGTITTVGTVSALAANAVNANALAADAVAEIQSGLATPTNITAGTITTVGTVNALATNSVNANAIAADAVTEVAGGVWASATRTLTSLPSLGTVDANLTEINGIAQDSTQLQDMIDDYVAGGFQVQNVTGSVNSVTELAAGAIASTSFAAGAIDSGAISASAANEIATALLDLASGVEASVTVRQALRAMAAVLAGNVSGSQTAAELAKAIGNSGTTRVTNSGDSSGNRTITLNL